MDDDKEDHEQPKESLEDNPKTVSPTTKLHNHSPKISVQGDYDQFARHPRKEKNGKIRDRSPVAASNKIKPNGEKQVSSSVDSERPKSRRDSKSNDHPGSKDNKKRKKSQNGNSPQRAAAENVSNMPVTNFGDGDDRPTHTISRLDSLPHRKHARVELMKQLRDEATENNQYEASSKNLILLHHSRNTIVSGTQGTTTTSHRVPQDAGFSPPVASVVDFLDNKDFRRRLDVFNRNIWDNFFQSDKIDPSTMKGLTTRYMVRYLGIAEDSRSKNVISSMLVRPILPPIKRKKKRRAEAVNEIASPGSGKSHQDAPKFEVKPEQFEHQESSKEPNPDQIVRHTKKNFVADMTYHFQRGTRLRQGDSKYVYRPRALQSTPVLGPTANSANEISDIGVEIKDDFDKVVRWKSKMRYCGNPAMYKRTTSPTLGEEAIKQKLTDRLPTRQTQKLWPGISELYSELHDQNESWRRPPSNANPKLSPVGVSFPPGNMTGLKPRPHRRLSIVAAERSGEVMDASSRHRAFGISLPPPQLPERKRRPMWQRM